MTIIKLNLRTLKAVEDFCPVFIESNGEELSQLQLLRLITSSATTELVDVAQVDHASQCGRIVSFDFSSHDWTNFNGTVQEYVSLILIRNLCDIFFGAIVDGIPFQKLGIAELHSKTDPARFRDFNRWFSRVRLLTVPQIIDEYRRLTRIAFRIRKSSPLVLLCEGIDNVGNDTFLSFIRTDILNANTSLVLLCSGRGIRDIVDELQNSSLHCSRSTLTVTNNDPIPKQLKRKRKYSRRVKQKRPCHHDP
jgi:hypothetical protein